MVRVEVRHRWCSQKCVDGYLATKGHQHLVEQVLRRDKGLTCSSRERYRVAQAPGDFRRLPVNDAGQDQVQAAAGVHLLPHLAGVNPTWPPVEDVSDQGEVAESGA
jgi:hypothetical protein